jgi:phytoene synthase
LVHSADPDRRLSSLFAAPDIRTRLETLYAFNHEIARIEESVSEGLIGEMRLTWWRDAVIDLYADPSKPRRHDVIEALAEQRTLFTRDGLLDLIEARRALLEPSGFADLDAITAYIDAAEGGLLALALTACEASLDEEARRLAARAWGLTGLARAHPYRLAKGRALMSSELAEQTRRAAFAAYGALRQVKAPAEAFPALGHLALTPGYLKTLPAPGADIPADPPGPSLIGKQARLVWASLSGRF